jgi:ABC-2 type transport system permease protein
MMQANAGGRSAGVVFLFYLLTLVPIALAYLARYAFDSEIAFAVILAAAAFGGVVLYRAATDSAALWATANREKLLAELSKGAGPVVTG